MFFLRVFTCVNDYKTHELYDWFTYKAWKNLIWYLGYHMRYKIEAPYKIEAYCHL